VDFGADTTTEALDKWASSTEAEANTPTIPAVAAGTAAGEATSRLTDIPCIFYFLFYFYSISMLLVFLVIKD
jgi:hypothetical protein